MIQKRIKTIERRRTGGTVDLWGANHFVLLSNEAEVLLVLREMRLFLSGPH